MKHKKFFVGFLAAMLAAVSAFALAACGSGEDPLYQPTQDWSQVKFSEYDPETYLAKTDVAYSCGKYDGTSMEGVASMISCNLILYIDGSAFAVTGFDKKGVFPINSGIKAYDDNYIKDVSYGYWTKDGNNITIKLRGLRVETLNGNETPLDELVGDWQTYTGTVEGEVLTVPDFKAENGGTPYAVQSNDYESMQEYLDNVPSAF